MQTARTETNTVDVIFRTEKKGQFKGEVTAVFPGMYEGPGRCTCYIHVGQHGTCCRDWYRETRPATKAEYAPLLRELRSIGYDDLRIIQRWRY